MNRIPLFLYSLAIFLSAELIAQSSADKADALYQAAQQLYDAGKYQSAADSVEKAATIFESKRNIGGQVKSLNLLGECKANLNQCDPSLEILNRSVALALANFKPESSEVAYAYYYLARSLGGCVRRHNEAIATMHKSINLKRELFGEGVEVAFDYTYMGYMFFNLTRYDSSLYYLEKSLRIREKKLAPDDVELANTLYHTGRTYEGKGELLKALDLHTRSLKIRMAKLDPLHASLSNSLSEVGKVYQKLGNPDRALDYLKRALEIRIRSLGAGHANVAASYYTIGNLYGTMFNYHQAIHYIKPGNSIYEKIYGDKSDVLPFYNAYLGSLYGNIGEHQTALAYFKKAQGQAEKILAPDNQNLAAVYQTIGNYYADNSSVQKALDYLNKSVAIFRKGMGANSVREADVVVKMGTIHANNKNFDKAFEQYQLALTIYKTKMGSQNPKVAMVYQLMGDVYFDQHQFEKSLANYQKAFVSMSTAFGDTTNVFLNPTTSQLENKPLALRIAGKKADVLAWMSKQSNDTNYLEHAFSTYLFSVDLMDDIASGYHLERARAEFEKESRIIYDRAMSTAHQLNVRTKEQRYIQDAFQISEKSKAAILTANIRESEAKFLGGVPDSLVEKERDIKVQLAYCQNALHTAMNKKDSVDIAMQEENVFNTQQQYNKLKSSLEKDFPSYYNLKYNTRVASLEQTQQALPNENTALVEYFVSDSAIYKFTVSKKSIGFEKVENDAQFAALMHDYEKCLTDADFILNSRKEADSLYASTAYALYDILLSSSVKKNPTLTKLIIVPDGKLGQFSFGSLITNEAQTKNPDYKNLNYLSTQFEISCAYSASLTNNVKVTTRRKPTNLFAGFAPSYSGNQFANMDTLKHPMTYLVMRSGNLPLPGAIEEVKLISQFMEGDSWLSRDATETNFKMNAGKYDILHLAMHSLLNNEHPQYSELLFNSQNDKDNDGYLTVDEIYNLNLNASMVVLSACSSGFGKVQQGEGPISISRAFSYAGCPSVVMSLWKIPDEVTRHIMTNFYQELKNGKPKDEALRLAQLKFLRETKDPLYHHPYFWGSFVVIGDASALPNEFPWWMVYSGLAITLVVVVFYYRKTKMVRTAQVLS
jgi:CHAT domain-containing protein